MIIRTLCICNALLIFLLSACGVAQDEYDDIMSENKVLKERIDELENGEDRLIATVEKAYAEEKFESALRAIHELKERHPQSKKIPEFAVLLLEIKEKQKILKAEFEAAEKERLRLENLTNTGIWRVGYFVDDFGEATTESFIRNSQRIRGKFSNSATQDSDLDVVFLITGSSEFALQLYEYAGTNPVKAHSNEKYIVLMQDAEGNRERLQAINSFDRLRFGPSHSSKLHSAFLRGGTIKFAISEADRPTTNYDFIIKNADLYENAYRKFSES